MEIILDEREHALYEKCMLIQHGTATPSYASIATMTKKVLPLGDVTVAIDDMQWIIERKSLSDLLSSIKDGRYDEQSYRLQHTADPRRVIYVIEGVLTTLKTPRERKLVHATMNGFWPWPTRFTATLKARVGCHIFILLPGRPSIPIQRRWLMLQQARRYRTAQS